MFIHRTPRVLSARQHSLSARALPLRSAPAPVHQRTPLRSIIAHSGRAPARRMVTEALVRQRVREVFESGDLETLTERKVKAAIADKLGEAALRQFEAVVSDELEKLLQDLADHSDEDEEEQENVQGPPAKKAKVANGEYTVQLSGRKKVTVKVYNKNVQVDLREWYDDKATGQEKPGKGIALRADEWQLLCPQLNILQTAMESGDTEASVQLSDARRAYVSDFKGKMLLQVREFYKDAQGEDKPGKKGCSLDQDSLGILITHAPDITAHAQQLAAKHGTSTAAKPRAANEGAAAAAAPGPSGSKAAADAPAARTTRQSGGGGAVQYIDLGGSRRVTVSDFNGTPYVNLREYYEKGSEWLPGKKGISIKPADWRTIVSALPDINAALERKDMSYALPLTNKRKVSLSEFKGKVYVAVREFYVGKDGQDAPGAKGLNLTADQWRTLSQQAQAFTDTVVPQ